MAYCGFVVSINELTKHSNADRLQVANLKGCQVIVGMDTRLGDRGVMFPAEGQLDEDFARKNGLLREKDEFGNPVGNGYLDPIKRNIQTLRLRGERSEGIFVSLKALKDYCDIDSLKDGDEITTLGGVEICKKYVPTRKNAGNKVGMGKKVLRQNIAPTFYEHIDTAQLLYNLDRFKCGQTIEITLKMHGTSGRTGYLPLLQKQNLLDKILRRTRKNYGYISGTRRVVLSNTNTGFYEDNSFRIRMEAKLKDKLNKGETIYYEIVGYVNKNTLIMPSVDNKKVGDKNFLRQYGSKTEFTYGCENGECEMYVYRITMTNEDGDNIEYSPDQIRARCVELNVKTVPFITRFIIPENCNPGDYVKEQAAILAAGPDIVDPRHLREGVVVRIVSNPNFSVYKHKSFEFKLLSGIAIAQMEEAAVEINETLAEEF